MAYILVADAAKAWNISERSVRNYCQSGRIDGAQLIGKTWHIPENAQKPERTNKKSASLLDILQKERHGKAHGGIYHKIQIELTYNSNHIEGSRLTHEQTRFIYETNTIGAEGGALNVDDIIETTNHFRCVDMVIDNARAAISEGFIKALHRTLKSGTSDSRRDWFAAGDYKRLPNEVGGNETAAPGEVGEKMRRIIFDYNQKRLVTLDDIIEFHQRFESIHPFQDGNGRVGRLIMFKECLGKNIVPFIIDDTAKMFYYRGLSRWNDEKGYLRDTCLSAQDKFKTWLDYFKIAYR